MRKNIIYCLSGAVCYMLSVSVIVFFSSGISLAQDSVVKLKDETLSYFKPLKGKVISVVNDSLVSDLGEKSGIRKGMRFTIFREGTPFLHPVTKEIMGKVETPVGKAEVREVNDQDSSLRILNGDVRVNDIVRISEMKIRVLFYQDRSVDWNLADSYYQLLRESGRLDIVDTSLDSADDAKIVAEAKQANAEVALVITGKRSDRETMMMQRIIWVADSSMLAENEVKVSDAYVKGLRSSASMVTPLSTSGDVLLFFDLPYSGKLVTAGDFRGDGNQELVIGTSRELQVYALGTSLQNLYELKGSATDEFLWVDAADVNGDGKDEIIVTSLRGRKVDTTGDSTVPVIKDEGDVVSYIYGLKGSEFSMLWKGDLFLRVAPSLGLVAQKNEIGGGFGGPVFHMRYQSGEVRMGDVVRLPKGVNIYDFVYLDGPEGVKYTLAYDDGGYLNLYNDSGLKIWRSAENYGGFPVTFKRTGPTVMVDRGEWSIKDRLYVRNRESFVVKRIPLANVARGLGYKNSEIRTLWWTGFSMEESALIQGISGGIIDYAFVADKLIVLSKPLFGLKPKNILKGQSPLGSMIYVYSLKGR